MPRLALFTQRDIQSGEELTFDYASSSSSSKTGSISKANDSSISFQLKHFPFLEPLSNETSSSVKGEKTVINECRCGSEKCRKIMFSLPENQMSFHTTDWTTLESHFERAYLLDLVIQWVQRSMQFNHIFLVLSQENIRNQDAKPRKWKMEEKKTILILTGPFFKVSIKSLNLT